MNEEDMGIDIEELRKNSRILVAIFEQAYKTRLNANRITNPSSSDDGQHDIAMALTEGIAVENIHLIFTKTLEKYDWNLEEFFLSAANPQMDLFHNKDWKAIDPNLYKDKQNNPFLKEYNERYVSIDIVQSNAKEAIKNIYAFGETLKL